MTRFEPISEDPDLVQAIEDFAPAAMRARDLVARAIALPRGTQAREQLERDIRGELNGLDLRARRIGLTGAALFEVINAAVDMKARRGRPVPARDTSRTLLTNITNAHARVETAREGVKHAAAELAEAEAHLAACEGAAVAWGARRRGE